MGRRRPPSAISPVALGAAGKAAGIYGKPLRKKEWIDLERYYLAIIANMRIFRYAELIELLARFQDGQALWRAGVGELCAAGLNKDAAERFSQGRQKYDPDKLADFCAREAVRIITVTDKEYPPALLNIANPPFALFVKGRLSDNALAIVGSRKASSYGLSVARQFAADLSNAGFSIVSGGAKGIDSAAHEGALSVAGHTVAVFGCGIDVCYPQNNKRLYDAIFAEGGGLVTEYLPGDKPLDWHFPMRNRIISGLSKGVLVVEAHKKSGSLLTADLALEAGREVYCVPGSIYSSGSIGVHNLIKQGARLVDRPEDIINELGGLFVPDKFTAASTGLSGKAMDIYDNLIVGKHYVLDEIAGAAGLTIAQASELLLEMELSGWVEANAGIYQRKERGGR